MDFYHRETAKNSVRRLIENLSTVNHRLDDAIRMIDREIGGLLAHPKSPYFNVYREYAKTIFPSGLEATKPGHDIILTLNKNQASLVLHGRQYLITIPKSLKNPERGVAHIIGQDLALELFYVRKKVLGQLKKDIHSSWGENLDANQNALDELKNYLSPQKRAIHKKLSPIKARGFFNEQSLVTSKDETHDTDTPECSLLSIICPCIS
jgi:hypothetical protein